MEATGRSRHVCSAPYIEDKGYDVSRHLFCVEQHTAFQTILRCRCRPRLVLLWDRHYLAQKEQGVSMTPEQRVERFIGARATDKYKRALAAEIRAAENDALERAAEIAGRSYPIAGEAALIIRLLKHKES